MKFEEALKAMREGKKVWNERLKPENGWDLHSYLAIKPDLKSCSERLCYFVGGRKKDTDDVSKFHFNLFESPFILDDNWYIYDDEHCTIIKSVIETVEKPDKIDIKITFIGGGEIIIPDEQWDDYRYDGKFFTIVKNGTDIAMYNAKQVFSLVLEQQGGD